MIERPAQASARRAFFYAAIGFLNIFQVTILPQFGLAME
jgi:hypothetical protein